MRVYHSKWSPPSKVQLWRNCWQAGHAFSMRSCVRAFFHQSSSTGQKSIGWRKKKKTNKPVLQSGHIQGKLPTRIQTFAAVSRARGREEAPTCLPAHTWATCLVSKSGMCLLFTPHHSCLQLTLCHWVGSASSTYLWLGGEKKRKRKKKCM